MNKEKQTNNKQTDGQTDETVLSGQCIRNLPIMMIIIIIDIFKVA